MRRRAAALGVVLVLAGAAPAGAQEPIAGGGSFNDAPVLAPGRYADTLRGGEQLFYGVRLLRGQKITAEATVSGRTDAGYALRLQIYSPLREAAVFDGNETALWDSNERSLSIRVVGERVGEDDGGADDDLYAEPGVYYVGLTADDSGKNLDAVQFDTEISLEVTGKVVPEPTATPTPAREEATPAPESGSTAGLGGGPGDGGGGELGMAIVFGLALGGIVGFSARRLRSHA